MICKYIKICIALIINSSIYLSIYIYKRDENDIHVKRIQILIGKIRKNH